MTKLNGKSVLTKLVQPLTIILIGAVARLIPHVPNLTPIAAMALFGGVYMSRKQAFVIPILAMIISDFFIGFDSISMRLVVYGSFLLIILIGFWLKNHKNAKNILLVSLLGSLIFFIATNFAVWAFGGMYPRNFSGLTESYVMAIPFFRNTLMGDIFYTSVFFGGYELAIMNKWSKRLSFSW